MRRCRNYHCGSGSTKHCFVLPNTWMAPSSHREQIVLTLLTLLTLLTWLTCVSTGSTTVWLCRMLWHDSFLYVTWLLPLRHMTPSSFRAQLLLTLRISLRLATLLTLLTCVSIGTTTVLFCQMRCGASTKDIRPMWRGVCVRESVFGWVCAYVYVCVRVYVYIRMCVYAARAQK